ncbi:unnamed protein product [Cochlearia groenlandica]
MEEELKRLSKSLGGFCNHLQSSCDAFNQSLHRRPIPLDSASSTFIKSLNRRISTAGSDLNFLDSMSFGTVSFEELLGHCNQIFKYNQDGLLHLQDRLSNFGYVPDIEIDESRDKDSDFGVFKHDNDNDDDDDDDLELSALQLSIRKGLDEDDILDDSSNLKSLGLSDACLATLASQSQEKDDAPLEMERPSGPTITLVKEEYESLPSYMKALASWEDLASAVQKLNMALSGKKEVNGSYYIRADEIPTLGLGHKEKSYRVLLTKMKKLLVETTDGVVSYKVA